MPLQKQSVSIERAYSGRTKMSTTPVVRSRSDDDVEASVAISSSCFFVSLVSAVATSIDLKLTTTLD